MQIDFPNHRIGEWQRRPWWMFWAPQYRRRHWRWTVDHRGCYCTFYWQYGYWGEPLGDPRYMRVDHDLAHN